MIVAAHQPAYLPWLGYFDKIARADAFVLLDDVQYEAQNFQNRNRIKLATGAWWLTVPLRRRGRDERICDKLIADEGEGGRHHWRRRSLATLDLNYRRAPYYGRYRDALVEAYHLRWARLVDLDLYLLRRMMEWLDVRRPIFVASTMGLSGQKTDRILSFCQKLGATRYLSGSGGSRGYLDVAKLREAGIEVEWQRFEHPRYPQRHPHVGFIPHLSALDALFNCGPAAAGMIGTSSPKPTFAVAAAGGA